MAVETVIFTRQPALTWGEIEAAGRADGWHLRRLDAAQQPAGPSAATADRPIAGQALVVLGWPAGADELTAEVDRALGSGDKAALDRLGAAGGLAWFDLTCRPYSFAQFQADAARDFDDADELDDDEDEDADDEVGDPADPARFQGIQARYFCRSAIRPARHADLLGRVARIIREQGDGFAEEW